MCLSHDRHVPFTGALTQYVLLHFFMDFVSEISCIHYLHCVLNSCISVNAKVEARLVVQALRVNTLSKLTFADSKRFDALVRDIFPGVDFKGVEYAELADALRTSAQESNLMVMETQVNITHYFCQLFKVLLVPLQS